MAHAQKPDFVFRRNGGVHLNRQGRQFSRLLAAEVRASAVVMLDTPCSEVVWRVLAIHSIRHFHLHFPSRASLCTIRFQLDSTVRCLGHLTLYWLSKNNNKACLNNTITCFLLLWQIASFRAIQLSSNLSPGKSITRAGQWTEMWVGNNMGYTFVTGCRRTEADKE